MLFKLLRATQNVLSGLIWPSGLEFDICAIDSAAYSLHWIIFLIKSCAFLFFWFSLLSLTHTQSRTNTKNTHTVLCVWPAGCAQQGGINRMADMKTEPNVAHTHGVWPCAVALRSCVCVADGCSCLNIYQEQRLPKGESRAVFPWSWLANEWKLLPPSLCWLLPFCPWARHLSCYLSPTRERRAKRSHTEGEVAQRQIQARSKWPLKRGCWVLRFFFLAVLFGRYFKT